MQQLLPILGEGSSVVLLSLLAADFAHSIQALKRVAQPDDISGAVAFLASNEARWITGEILRVDGGSKL